MLGNVKQWDVIKICFRSRIQVLFMVMYVVFVGMMIAGLIHMDSNVAENELASEWVETDGNEGARVARNPDEVDLAKQHNIDTHGDRDLALSLIGVGGLGVGVCTTTRACMGYKIPDYEFYNLIWLPLLIVLAFSAFAYGNHGHFDQWSKYIAGFLIAAISAVVFIELYNTSYVEAEKKQSMENEILQLEIDRLAAAKEIEDMREKIDEKLTTMRNNWQRYFNNMEPGRQERMKKEHPDQQSLQEAVFQVWRSRGPSLKHLHRELQKLTKSFENKWESGCDGQTPSEI